MQEWNCSVCTFGLEQFLTGVARKIFSCLSLVLQGIEVVRRDPSNTVSSLGYFLKFHLQRACLIEEKGESKYQYKCEYQQINNLIF